MAMQFTGDKIYCCFPFAHLRLRMDSQVISPAGIFGIAPIGADQDEVIAIRDAQDRNGVGDPAFCADSGKVNDRHNVPVGAGNEVAFRDPADGHIDQPDEHVKQTHSRAGGGHPKNHPAQMLWGGHSLILNCNAQSGFL